MKAKPLTCSFDGSPVTLWLPETGAVTRVMLVMDEEILMPLFLDGQITSALPEGTALVPLSGKKRLDSYTPWPSESLNERFPPFGGKADEAIRQLQTRLLPEIQAAFPGQVLSFSLLGYSLGGLFAVYASFQTDAFREILSLSGSFWYPGWDEFIRTHAPANRDIRYVLLCGEKEGRGKRNAQGQAVDRTKLTHERLCALNGSCPLILDPGGHHDRLPERLEKALAAL